MSLKLPEIPALDPVAAEEASARQDSLTKPPGSLGRLEEIAVRIAGMQSSPRPYFRRRYAVVAAADHGVVAEGVSAYPQAVTAQMVMNFLAGGAAINALAKEAGVEVVIVDAGVASELPPDERIKKAGIAPGTANFASGPAMSRSHAESIVGEGVRLGVALASEGNTAVVAGEMGIGNTTSAAALTSVLTRTAPAEVTGQGTGIDSNGVTRKISVIQRAIEVNRPDRGDTIDVLSKVGGYEIGFLAGLMLGVASHRGVIVLDGFISTAAGLVAAGLDERATDYMIAGHRSFEPGHDIALSHLGLDPVLDLNMRLGEGTGAVLALKVIDSALAAHNGMATFAEASVSGPAEERS